MSVIVMGMEMPESCAKCKLKTWTNTDPYCHVIQSKLEWNKYSSGSWVGIDKRCPLRPLPEKHGRLIDADAFIQQCRIEGESHTLTHDLNRYKLGMGELIDLINVRPTIVEAEGD